MGMHLHITVGNAAFADGDRAQELSRIIRAAADKLENDGPGFPVYDVNGNQVGRLDEAGTAPSTEGDHVLISIVELGNASFDEGFLQGGFVERDAEVARILRDAARRIGDGGDDFSLRDKNGNTVGKVTSHFSPEAELDDNDGEADEEDDELTNYGPSNAKPYNTSPIFGDEIKDRRGMEWLVVDVDTVDRDGKALKEPVFTLLDADNLDVSVLRGLSALEGLPLIRKLEYVINLDERGEFDADVRQSDGDTLFEIKGAEIFEDGFMSHGKDLDGLTDYLRSLDIIGPHDTVFDTTRFQEMETRLNDALGRATERRSRFSGVSYYGTIHATTAQRALLQSIGVRIGGLADNGESLLVRLSPEAYEAFTPYREEYAANLHALSDYDKQTLAIEHMTDEGLAAYVQFLRFAKTGAESVPSLDSVADELADAETEVRDRAAQPAPPVGGTAPNEGNEPS